MDRPAASNSDSTRAWYKNFRPFYKRLSPQAMTVGEIWDGNSVVTQYTQGDQLDLAFDFDLAKSFMTALRSGRAEEVASTLSRDYGWFKPGQYATFLSNHDMNRVMSQLAANVDKARSGATLLLTAPGVPFIYYGEEIGMLGKKPDEEIRTPMQWSADKNAGFTAGSPWAAVNPDFPDRNVADESADPDSLLSHYRALIRLRNQHAALRVGNLLIVTSNHPSVFASLRASQDEAVLVVINLEQDPLSDYRLSLASGPLAAGSTYLAAPLLGDGPFASLTVNAQGGFEAYQPLSVLPPNGNFIIQLQLAN